MFGFFKKHVRAGSPKVVSQSAVGLRRADNQDNLYIGSDTQVYCVADGMGGGAEGAKASAIVCSELKMMLHAAGPDAESRRMAVRRGLQDANATIFAYAQSRGFAQMGSTAVVALLDPEAPTRVDVFWVGDSRAYRIRGGLARPFTRDHRFGTTNYLTQAVGVQPTVRVDTVEMDVRAGDRILLCSDGVHGVISDARLAVFAGAGSLATARTRLSSEIERAGAPDNYTFILIGL